MGRNALAMFLDLGHDRGARSLGETFVDFFLLALEAVASYVAEIVTEHVVRDFVEVNFGQDEAYPEVGFDRVTGESPLTAEALKALVEAGVVTPDDDLETEVRRRHRLPPRPGEPVGPPSEDIGGVDEVPVVDDGVPEDEGEVPGGGPTDGEPPSPGPSDAPDGKVYVKPHIRRRPGVTFDELEARLAAASRRLVELKGSRRR